MGDKDGKTKSELLNEEEKQAIIDATPTAAEKGDLQSLQLLLSYQYPSDKDGRLLPFEVSETLHKPFIYGAYHAMTCNKPEKFEFLNQFGLKEHDGMSVDKLPEGQLLNIQHLLDMAAEHGSVDCAGLMIEKYGANPNLHRIPSGVRPLYVAAWNNKLEMVVTSLKTARSISISEAVVLLRDQQPCGLRSNSNRSTVWSSFCATVGLWIMSMRKF